MFLGINFTRHNQLFDRVLFAIIFKAGTICIAFNDLKLGSFHFSFSDYVPITVNNHFEWTIQSQHDYITLKI